MKKFISISGLLIILGLVLSSCSSLDKKDNISDHSWELESVTDLQGIPLDNEFFLTFNNKGGFILKDRSQNKEWRGKYSKEKLDSSYKVDLFFKDRQEPVTAGYGRREYQDKTDLASLVFQFDSKILSFIARD